MASHNLVTVFPKDILIRILALIASDSVIDLVNTKLACKALLEASADDSIYRSANLTPFSIFSWSVGPSATAFLEQCVASGNPEALFRKGILEYLSSNAIDSGILHLGKAADSGHPESIYFYGIVRLSQGEHEAGMALLNSLGGSFGGHRWLETIRYCRVRVGSIIESLWVWTTIAEPQGRRGCHCSPRNVVRYEGWEPKEEIELRFYVANGCPFCFWEHEARALCSLLRSRRAASG